MTLAIFRLKKLRCCCVPAHLENSGELAVAERDVGVVLGNRDDDLAERRQAGVDALRLAQPKVFAPAFLQPLTPREVDQVEAPRHGVITAVSCALYDR